jgi:N utilization substance protein B
MLSMLNVLAKNKSEDFVPFSFDERSDNEMVQCDILPVREQRTIVFYLLYMIDVSDYEISMESVIDQFSRGYFCIIKSDGFIVQRAIAIAQEREQLDADIKPLLQNWKLDRLSVATRLILRMALWELKNTQLDVPVVINEALELAKTFGEQDSYKFVNGILDEWSKRHPRPDKVVAA